LLAGLASGCFQTSPETTTAAHDTVTSAAGSNAREQTRLRVAMRDPLDDANPQTAPASVGTQSPAAQDDPATGAEAAAGSASVNANPAAAQDEHPIIDAPSGDEPTVHTVQLAPLPRPSAGACAFEPLASAPSTVDNINCPDGIWHGHLGLHSDADVESARGCTRVTGSVAVETPFLTSLHALKSLRVIEGDLYFSELACSTSSSCVHSAPKLTDLAGLDALRCVGGQLLLAFSRPFDAAALHNLVEIGNDLQFYAKLPDETFTSLRRVWGNVSALQSFAAPRLEAVYGHYDNQASTAGAYVGCKADEYCRDGVLGCDFIADSPAQLQQLSSCEIAVHDVYLSGSALSALSVLDQLRYVNGTLTLSSSDIQTISGLATLRAVGTLRVETLPHLTNLAGLSHVALATLNMTELDELEHPAGTPGNMYLQDLPELESLNGLSQVEALQSLQILRSPGLRDLSGLGALRDAGYLHLEDDANLQSLAGTATLRGVAQVALLANPVLNDISALSTLSSVGVSLEDLPALADLQALHGVEITNIHAQRLPLLRNLDGLEAVRARVSTIELRENAALEEIDALSPMHEAFEITITDNPKLRTLQGLAGLTSLDYSSDVSQNPLLPQCEVDALQARVPLISGGANDFNATCSP
jgi:hypothetical protein